MRKLFLILATLFAFSAGATQSSKTTCEGLLADNTSNAISPQDLRDCTTESVPFLDGTHTVAFINPDGTAVAPSLAFDDAVNGNDNGFFWDETGDYIGIAINGAEISALGDTWIAPDGGTCADLSITSKGVSPGTSGISIDNGTGNVRICRGGTEVLNAAFDGFSALNVRPTTNNTYDLGSATLRWQDVYALNLKADDAGTAVTIPAIDNDGSPVVFSDVVQAPDGLSTAPGLSFCDDTLGCDHGMFWDDTLNTLYLVYNGDAAAFTITSGSTLNTKTHRPVGDNIYDLGINGGAWNEVYTYNVKATSGAAVTIPVIDNDGSAVAVTDDIHVTGAVEVDDTTIGTAALPAFRICDSVDGCDFGMYLDTTNNQLVFSVNGAARVGIWNNTAVGLRLYGALTVNTDNAFDIGTSSLRFQDVYALNLKADDAGTAVTIPAIDNDGALVSFSDGIELPNGSATVPSLTFVGDTDNDTGIYLLTEDRLIIATNGATRVTFGESNAMSIAGNTLPSVDSSYNLGGTGNYWARIYADYDHTGRLIDNQTANKTVTASTDLNKLWTNAGAVGSVTFTLPTAVAGQRFSFYVAAAQQLQITAAAGDDIRVDGTVTGLAGSIDSSTVGDFITLTAIDADHWVATDWISPTDQW